MRGECLAEDSVRVTEVRSPRGPRNDALLVVDMRVGKLVGQTVCMGHTLLFLCIWGLRNIW